MKNLSSKHGIKVLTDQITSPTYAHNLAEMLFEIVDKKLRGIIHVSGSSQISRFNQAIEIASVYNLDKNLIIPISLNQMNWKAPRPKNSSLNITKANDVLIKKPAGFKESLLQFATAIH
jgi:dTDP-4-dehydrorhamnose reductase